MSGAKERPILFRGPMVRAILEGRKSQTRRVLKHDTAHVAPLTEKWGVPVPCPPPEGQWIGCDANGTTTFMRCPYGVPGDRLWVREAHQINAHGTKPNWTATHVIYAADNETRELPEAVEYVGNCDIGLRGWHPSIFMPRWASRLLLEITDVRVQRVQEISEEDAAAEGIAELVPGKVLSGVAMAAGLSALVAAEPAITRRQFLKGSIAAALGLAAGSYVPRREPTQRELLGALWDSINAKRGHGWDSNPWVWAVTFRRVEGAR